MIVGVDHIALSCENVAQGAELLRQVGFRAKFIQERVPNPAAKRNLLRSYEPSHSIAYCQAEGSVSLELTAHSRLLGGIPSPYQVLLNRFPDHSVFWEGELPPSWESAWRTSMGCIRPRSAKWTPFQAQFWCDAESDGVSLKFVRALLLPVNDLSVAERFWVQGLGCQRINRGETKTRNNWLQVGFRAPVPAWCLDIVLVEMELARVLPLIDDAGFPCLALISSRLGRDKEVALGQGAREASDEFNLEVGGRVLNILIMRGPDNELVELIEFSKTSPRR